MKDTLAVASRDSHYDADDMVSKVTRALDAAGLGTGTIDWRALASLDQFHVGGLEATADLVSRLDVRAGSSGLDVGCGLGGPSRYLAAMRGCRVTGIDLSPGFIDVATLLTERTRLANRVRHVQGDATALPFAAQSFDFAWTQHVAMNIADRQALYAGIFKVLRLGAKFAIYEAVAGEGGDVIYPVPWARDARDSFLLSADETRSALEDAGFVMRQWRDATEIAVDWRRRQMAGHAARSDAVRSLALPLVMGEGFPGMGANFERNLVERRVRLLQAIVERPL